jgi:hypothetical protein
LPWYDLIVRSWRQLILLASALAVVSMAAPVRSHEPQSETVCCCAQMTEEGGTADCGNQTMPSKPDQPCCYPCAMGFSFLLATQDLFVRPSVPEYFLTLTGARQISRSDRPSVPPPRSTFV